MTQSKSNYLKICRGDFSNLPPSKPNLVKIFLSSTFSGINLLNQHAYLMSINGL